jgi:hemerythrin-like domain-containing protein
MKATELLQKQHREIEQRLERLRAAAPEDEGAIRKELADLLVAHTVIEQEHFYPAIRDVAPERILEAIEEHGLAEYALARDLSAYAGGEDARARASVLADVVLSHIRKEENELFRRADAALTNQELAELGEAMMKTFEAAHRQGYQRLLARALAANMPKIGARGQSARRGQAKKATARGGRRATATAAKRGQARKAKAGARGQAKAGTAKRGTAKRSTAKRGTTKRSTAKRGATTTQGARGGATKQGARQGAKRRRRTRRTSTRGAKDHVAG